MASDRDQQTLKHEGFQRRVSGSLHVLTISCHPDPSRVGDRQALSFDNDGRMAISRFEPEFEQPGTGRSVALDDPYVSRRPFHLAETADGAVELVPNADGTAVRANGEAVTKQLRLTPGELQSGVVLELGGRVVLVLHGLAIDVLRSTKDNLGLVGHSGSTRRVRKQVRRVAKHDVPVLVRGSSGTGKELVATAVHQHSGRAKGPFISVNMAAIPESTAPAQLFGHAAGAYTGAVGSSPGFFGSAAGGTLFLDEIGETSLDVQAALLRALENGEVQPVGEQRPRKVDVRLVAATDLDLAEAVEDGRFRRALYERLRGYEVHLSPLRERREDVGILLAHFLREELSRVGQPDKLDIPGQDERPWLPAWLVADATLHDWPGNVRELRNAARQLVIDWYDAPEIPPDQEVERLFGASRASVLPETEVKTESKRAPVGSLSEPVVLEALRKAGWRPSAAAKDLGVSRSAFYAFIQSCPAIPKATSLTAEQIDEALDQCDGSTKGAADELCVTERALKLRIRELGLA